jgi:hypothetical protein
MHINGVFDLAGQAAIVSSEARGLGRQAPWR